MCKLEKFVYVMLAAIICLLVVGLVGKVGASEFSDMLDKIEADRRYLDSIDYGSVDFSGIADETMDNFYREREQKKTQYYRQEMLQLQRHENLMNPYWITD